MMKFALSFALTICASMALSGAARASDASRPPDTASESRPAPALQRPLVVLYASPASMHLLQRGAMDLRARVNLWRDLLRERGDNYRILTQPEQWRSVAPGAAIVLVSAYAMSQAEQQLLQDRLAAGDSLLATGYPASRDESDKPVVSSFVSSVFGPLAPTAERAPTGEFMVVVGDTPLTYPLNTGTRLWLGKDEAGARPALRRPGAGYLSDWSRQPGPSGLLSFASNDRTRRVLLGWPETAWDPRTKDWHTLAGAALDWVEGRPLAYLATWPAPYRAAMSFGVNATWRFENLPHVAQLFQAHAVRASFYLLASDAARQVPILSQLVQGGHDVGSLGDLWRPFVGETAELQAHRVEIGAQSLRKALGEGQAFSGLRTPEGATDANTESAVLRQGGDYLVDLGRIDSVVPVLAQAGQLTLLSDTLTLDTDNAAESARWGQSLIDQRERALALHGYAFVGLDAAAMTPDSALDATLNRFLTDSRSTAPELWLASAAQVSHWWKARQRIKLESHQEDADLVLKLDVATGPPIEFPVAISLVPPVGSVLAGITEPRPDSRLELRPDGTQSLVITGLSQGTRSVRLHLSAPR